MEGGQPSELRRTNGRGLDLFQQPTHGQLQTRGRIVCAALDAAATDIEEETRAPVRATRVGADHGAPIASSHARILVTQAERPHPFPSRTRKLSSPAPKILRGQPLGKIGRRQDLCVSGGSRARPYPSRVQRAPFPAPQAPPVVPEGHPAPEGAPQMAVPGHAPQDGFAPPSGSLATEDWLDVICPYLRASDGAWRSATPEREHRCWALDPVVELPVVTQQRLCLAQTHAGCERYVYARERRFEALARYHIAPERVQAARFGPFVSPVPLAIEPESRRSRLSRVAVLPRIVSGTVPRTGLPVAMAVIVAAVVTLALLAVVFGNSIGVPATGLASPTPLTAASVEGQVPASSADAPTVRPPAASAASGTPAGTLEDTPRPTTGATPQGSVTPPLETPAATTGLTPMPTPFPTSGVAPASPAATQPMTASPPPSVTVPGRYVVQEGDTLRSIAERFGVTVRQLRDANDFGQPPVLTPGDEINIPSPAPSASPGAT